MRKTALAFSLATLIPGCCPHSPPTRPPYTGPTDSMEQVILSINHNAAAISTLWTQLDYTATLVNPEKHTTDTFSGDGSFVLVAPQAPPHTGRACGSFSAAFLVFFSTPAGAGIVSADLGRFPANGQDGFAGHLVEVRQRRIAVIAL